MKYKFNGVKPLNKAVLANNDLVGAGSWIEFAPGLSQAKIWQDAAGDDKIETLSQDDIRVLPGFGVSANPDFSSQGNLFLDGQTSRFRDRVLLAHMNFDNDVFNHLK